MLLLSTNLAKFSSEKYPVDGLTYEIDIHHKTGLENLIFGSQVQDAYQGCYAIQLDGNGKIRLFDFKGLDAGRVARFDCFPVKFFSFAAGLAVLCASAVSSVQSFALISLAIIALYNGERGRLRLKYFFYVFYTRRNYGTCYN